MDGSTLDKQCLGMEGTRVDEGGGQRQVEGAELCGGLCCGARKGKGRKGQVCVKCTWSAKRGGHASRPHNCRFMSQLTGKQAP